MKHYDADGNFIGESRPGWLGSMENYDANGNKTGESRPGWLGSMENYDANGNKIGESRPDCFVRIKRKSGSILLDNQQISTFIKK